MIASCEVFRTMRKMSVRFMRNSLLHQNFIFLHFYLQFLKHLTCTALFEHGINPIMPVRKRKQLNRNKIQKLPSSVTSLGCVVPFQFLNSGESPLAGSGSVVSLIRFTEFFSPITKQETLVWCIYVMTLSDTILGKSCLYFKSDLC